MPAKVQETIAKLLERVVVPPEQDAVVRMPMHAWCVYIVCAVCVFGLCSVPLVCV